MPKKPGKGKAKGLARAKTRPAGKKAKGRPFQAKDTDPKKARPELEEFDPGPHSDPSAPRDTPDQDTVRIEQTWTRPALRPQAPIGSGRDSKGFLRKKQRIVHSASVIAAGMLSNPELIEDFDDTSVLDQIMSLSVFMAKQIDTRVHLSL